MAIETLNMELTARVADRFLQVSYALANRSHQAIVAYDGAAGVGGGEYPDLTGQCYVSYAGSGLARILRIRPPAHPTMDTTHAFLPAVSVVDPGEIRHVKFCLALPVKERSEFSPEFSGATYQEQTVNECELRIGYFWKVPATILKPLGHPNVWQVVKGASLAETHEISGMTRVTFELLVRTDTKFIRL
ncbi:MAG: hypothetical protein WCD04_10195 [Terriglobia bacterium]|jgi:hypothetical protein